MTRLLATLVALALAISAEAQTTTNRVDRQAVATKITIGGSTFASTSSLRLAGLDSKTSETNCLWLNASGDGALGACGTVTSVALSVPSILSVSGSPITTSGTLAVTLANQTANTVFARSTGTGAPSFQSLTKAMQVASTVYTDQTNTWGAFLQTFGGGLTVSSGTTTTQALSSTAGTFSSTLGVTGLASLNGGIAVDSTNFTVDGTTGAVSTASTLNATGAATFGDNVGTSSFASRTTGWRVTSAGAADFRTIFTNEFRTQRFVADLEEAHNGVGLWAKAVTTLASAFTCPAAGGTATITVKDLPSATNIRVFSENAAGTTDNDWVLVRTFARTDGDSDGNLDLTIADCVGQVSSYVDNGGSPDAGTQSWTFTRGSGGNAGGMTASTVVPVDTAVIDYGSVGSGGSGTPGYAEVNAIDGSEGVNAPYFQVATWATSPVAANRSVRARFGKLTGITGTADEFGLLAGTYAATNGAYFRASNAAIEMHGVDQKFFSGSTNVLRLNPNGGDPYIALGSTLPTGIDTNAGIWLAEVSGVAQARIGDPSGNRLRWDGTNLKIVSQYLTIDENGVAITPTTSFTNTRAYTFKGTGGGVDFGMQGSEGANTQFINIEAVPTSGVYHGAIRLRATNATNGTGSQIFLEAQGGGGGTGRLSLMGEGGIDFQISSPSTTTIASMSAAAFSYDTNTLYVDGTNNRVGIGTTPGTYRLHVVGVNNEFATYIVGSATSGQSYGAIVDAGTTSGDWSFRVRSQAGTEYLAVRGDGNVGIGNVSPGYKVDVTGTVNATGFAAGGTAGITFGPLDPNTCTSITVKNGLITAKAGC